MSLFSRSNKKKVASSSSKNATYYKRENLIEDVEDLKKILNPLPKHKVQKSKREISFNTFPLRTLTYNTIQKDAGNPVFVLKNSDNIDKHEVVFYKDGVDYYKFLIQYHFINDQFFFASNKISSMGILSPSDKTKIVGQINLKYLGLSADEASQDLVIKVADENNSIITTIDDVYFHVNYLAGNETTNKLIQKYSGQTIEKNQTSGFSETLDKYI